MANETKVWRPAVEQHDHPPGEKGVNYSLEQVAERAAKGSLDPRVRAWAIECLDRARKKDLPVKGAVARARVLLRAVQEKLWVPDPVAAEFMAGAHLTACVDKDAPCFRGGDCDDLTVLLAAAFASVGIHTLIVGHAYDKGRHISHVLAAAFASDQWWYADPSTDFPLGKCEPFTRERLLGVPNAKFICDKDVCIGTRRIQPEEVEPVKGTFVGVNGLPEAEDSPVRWISRNFVDVAGIPGDEPVQLSTVRWLKGR